MLYIMAFSPTHGFDINAAPVTFKLSSLCLNSLAFVYGPDICISTQSANQPSSLVEEEITSDCNVNTGHPLLLWGP